MKDFLYGLKQAYEQVMKYPKGEIRTEPTDYDTYWKEKRGATIGALSGWQRKRADLTLLHIDRTNPVTLLDVGCGDGSILHYLMGKIHVKSATGVDVSEFALAKAKESGITVLKLDISDPASWEKIPAADYIFLFEVLEHVQDSERLLRLMHEKARKGIFFSFPNTGFYTYRLRLLSGKFPLQWRVHPGEHLRFWTYRDILWWLSALGYTSYTLMTYEGVPGLRNLWPSLFAAGLFVYLPKDA